MLDLRPSFYHCIDMQESIIILALIAQTDLNIEIHVGNLSHHPSWYLFCGFNFPSRQFASLLKPIGADSLFRSSIGFGLLAHLNISETYSCHAAIKL